MTYIVTKIEAHQGGYRVTAKDADTTKLKRRNVECLVPDAETFKVGQRVAMKMVSIDMEG